MSHENIHKVILLGDLNTGKTSLISRFTENKFSESNKGTLGIDFKVKQITLSNGQRVKVQIWDTAGSEKFRSVVKSYLRDSDVYVLVYDITSIESFRNIDTWMDEVDEARKEDSKIVIVGNKCDLASERVIQTSEAKRKAEELRAEFFETSAKTGENVVELFTRLAEEYYERKMKQCQSSEPSWIVNLPSDTTARAECEC